MPAKPKPADVSESPIKRLIVLNPLTDAALGKLAEREAAKTGGKADRLKSAIVRRLILEEHKRTSDR